MSVSQRIKNSVIRFLPKSVVRFLKNQVSLANIPKQKKSVVSDLFPFRIHDGWETYFELLNVPMLIDPQHQKNTKYSVRFIFFDESGKCFYEWNKEEQGCFRQTINLNELLNDKSISGYGTFACFHENYLPHLEAQDGFLAERGYTGYANQAYSKAKGYVHGNLDALAMNEQGETLCLGKSFRLRNNEYRLQHQLEGPATYELGFVNTSASTQSIQVEILSEDNQQVKLEKKYVPSKGIVWFSHKISSNDPLRVVIYSKLNLPRPVVFRVEENSFDVFHG